MLDKIQKELHKRNSNALAIGVFLAMSKIPVEPMPADKEILQEYLVLKKTMDDGEAACLAVAKYRKEYVASSNITQIATYCNTNGIKFYTTMDILHEATVKGIMTDADCDQFITEVKSKNSKLPCNSIAQYRTIKGLHSPKISKTGGV